MISVIVPVYKVEAYLRQCLDSIINQTYRDLEILLIDDGSPDKCGEICEEYALKDNRIRVFHTENRGLSASRNLGLREAKGEYIGFVDSDDWIEPDMYEVLLKRLEETRADICICGFWIETANISTPTHFTQEAFIGNESFIALVEGKITNYVWNKLYRRAIFEAVTFPVGSNHEDIASMHLFLFQSKCVAGLDSLKYHYRIRQGSITKTYSAENLIAYADAYLEQYWFLRKEYPDLFADKQDELLLLPAKGISRLWRWWHGCSSDEKILYDVKIREMFDFVNEHFPSTGFRLWPFYLRVSTVFMHSRSRSSFALLYWLNQMFRKKVRLL